MYWAKLLGTVYMVVEYGIFGKFRFITKATYDALSRYDNDSIYCKKFISYIMELSDEMLTEISHLES